MTKSATTNMVDGGTFDLLDEVRESAKAGQHGASEALRTFCHAVDHVIPENLQPMRKTIVDAAIEMADQLVTAQYEFQRSIVRSADRAMSTSDDPKS